MGTWIYGDSLRSSWFECSVLQISVCKDGTVEAGRTSKYVVENIQGICCVGYICPYVEWWIIWSSFIVWKMGWAWIIGLFVPVDNKLILPLNVRKNAPWLAEPEVACLWINVLSLIQLRANKSLQTQRFVAFPRIDSGQCWHRIKVLQKAVELTFWRRIFFKF